ncbi:MAG TPA: hypothetical protein DEQ26_11830 [Flavobacteriaceae bacterium]|nr:hypothetical protein [Flavobacteriaceae bacterium]
MIGHTKAFLELKTEQQKILDFTVLVCYAIPNLKKSVKGFKEKVPNYETFIKPDYFIEQSDINKVSALAQDYKSNLAKYTLISAFSFFETYIRAVVKELVEFHGGQETFVKTLHERHKQFLNSADTTISENKKKLQEPIKKKNTQRYQKHITILDNVPKYRHPSELLATYGLKNFIETVTGNSFRSVMIPDLLEIGFCIDLSEKINRHPDLVDKNLRETFDIMRDARNNIGHGSSNDIGFEKVMDLIRFLRHLAVKTDEHLIDNFFVLERAN